jgi:hypothetical protein
LAERHQTEEGFVDTVRFDSLTKDIATGTTRRRTIAGLGALALGGAGLLALTQDAAADDRRRCIERCNAKRGDNASNEDRRDRRDRCRRKCENR